ncbi:phosphopyruvate hydratase [Patescibacteria group bacterium]|jgi:enolase|nr:phosphopyruvate hydratase [Patescibacteria group bacterium]HPD07694.1 phosphopyruvate hydratase [bacterium]HRT11018.1 phosphopyruvate hydratase [Patescibacteria group bacterium]HRU89717.1 phosphopyruvate hydratase [Patescibacteria group bacterium]
MAKIVQVAAREILDSRGDPTVEAKIILDNGLMAKASVPSGASTGVHEAHELRDGDLERYGGKGVLRAIANISEVIGPKIIGEDITELSKIDHLMLELDGTANKEKLGANAILAISMACARAGALATGQELYSYLASSYGFSTSNYRLPIPSFNIFNGGKHADTNVDFQEFMIIPLVDTLVAEKIRLGSEVFQALGRLLKDNGLDTNLGNEGGYAPNMPSSETVIDFIIKAIQIAGYIPQGQVGLGLDVGSSELYDEASGRYIFKLDQWQLTAAELINKYKEWALKYPLVSIEDGLAEDDWDNWQILTQELGSQLLLIGDDLFVTQAERLREGVEKKVANAILIKLNQVGTVSETIDCIKLAQQSGYKIMISHRSGETTDDFIADLAVAVGAEYIKSGSLARGERLAKYNRLMEIEAQLAGKF